MSGPVFHRAIKYQIYPNDQQMSLFAQTFGCVRKVYNMGLELQSGLYASDMKAMSDIDLNNHCNRFWKDDMPYLREVDKFALTNSIKDLGAAFKNFFEKRTGYPRYKSAKTHTQSYSTNYTQGNIAMDVPKNGCRGRIKLPKAGWVDANIHRKPEENWAIKGATVSRNAFGKMFVSILFAIPVEYVEPVTPILENTLGLDYSSPQFYVDSNGDSPDVPKAYRKAEARLVREQRRLSKMVKGSKNYEKQRLLVAKLHEHTANQRKDFCHKQSRKIANSYDVVCVEDIDLRGMSGALHLGKATMDNGFGMFRTFLKYKLEEAGKHFVVIDKWYPSTKTCHNCGGYNGEVHLGQNTWICPTCGEVIQRDHNAALNIRDEGFRFLQSQFQVA